MLKLYITESNYVTEAIDDIKKYYPNIPDGVFMQLIALDPTYRGNDSAGKYGKWLLNLYNKGRLSQDEFNEVPDLLNQFTIYRNRIANKDLNSYKSLDDLSNVLASVIDDDSMLTDRQKVRFLKNVKSGKVKVSAEDDYDIVLDTPKFVVYVPNTHEASMKLGKGTQWCTAHENPQWYDKYTNYGIDDSKLYIIKNKETGERWQYADKTNDFLDETDNEFNIQALFLQDKQLFKFFSQFGFKMPKGLDRVDNNGYYVYTGEPISKEEQEYFPKLRIASTITEIADSEFLNYLFMDIIIPNSITKIGNRAFMNCYYLKSVEIPNSVTSIGNQAFYFCRQLSSIIIPNSVTSIGREAFYYCSALRSIVIPDSVITLGHNAFDHCYSLQSVTLSHNITVIKEETFLGCDRIESIDIPNSVVTIEDSAFEGCTDLQSITILNGVNYIADTAFKGCNNLTVYTNNKYVINYCNENDIPTKPLNNNESINKNKRYKLHIK